MERDHLIRAENKKYSLADRQFSTVSPLYSVGDAFMAISASDIKKLNEPWTFFLFLTGSENNSLYLYYKGLSKQLLTFKFDTVRSVLVSCNPQIDTNLNLGGSHARQ